MQNEYMRAVDSMMNGADNAMIARKHIEIKQAKQTLAENDYKTIKNVQYERMGKPIPYPWEEVFAEAETLRKTINECEAQICNLLNLRGEENVTV